jgi:hypothetical protein
VARYTSDRAGRRRADPQPFSGQWPARAGPQAKAAPPPAKIRKSVPATRKHRFGVGSFDEYFDHVERGCGSSGQVFASLPQDTQRAVREDVRRDVGDTGGPSRSRLSSCSVVARNRASPYWTRAVAKAGCAESEQSARSPLNLREPLALTRGTCPARASCLALPLVGEGLPVAGFDGSVP